MAWGRYHRLLGLLSILACRSALCAYEDRVPGAVTVYDFPRDNCLSDFIQLSSSSSEGWFGDLELSEAVICNGWTGITGSDTNDVTPAVSKRDAGGLPARISNTQHSDGITLELWLKHPEEYNPNENLEIFGIRPPLSNSGDNPDQGDGCDMCLSIENGKYFLTLHDGEIIDVGPPVGGNDYEHFVITIDPITYFPEKYYVCNYYIDSQHVLTTFLPSYSQGGDAATSGTSIFEVDPWDSTKHLHLLGSGDFEWPGSIYFVAIYPRILTAAEIQQKYASGLPAPIPVVFDSSMTINEDGEVGDHYDDPTYYCEPVPTLDLQTFTLPNAYYASTDENSLAYDVNAVDPVIYISSIPSKGEFYGGSLVLITTDALPFQLSPDETLRYRPLGNESSIVEPYVTFTYMAVDAVDDSIELFPATVSIFVTPKNDPPSASDVTVSVQKGVPSMLCISGTDADDGDEVVSATILSLPTMGSLYEVTLEGDIGNSITLDGTELPGLCVSYPYTDGNLEAIDDEGLLAIDELSFAVHDSGEPRGTSLPASMLIKVYSGITSGPSGDETIIWQVYEDNTTVIELMGHDGIGFERPLSFVISSVPSYGNLIDPSTMEVLNAGDSTAGQSTAPYTQGVELFYQPTDNYFSKPAVQWNGTAIDLQGDCFSYYAAVSYNHLIRAAETTEEIEIINVNDPTEISCPLEAFHVTAMGAGLSGMSGPEEERNATISGFTIVDIDLGLDPIVASISIDYGIITLNPDYLSKLDFNSQTYCLGPQNWTCEGSGLSDKTMTFVADPYDVQMALNNMVYRGFNPGVTDYITITLHDGVKENCLENEQFTTDSLRTSCTRTSCRVAVEIGEFQSMNLDNPNTTSQGFLGLGNAPIQLLIGGAICVFFVMVILLQLLRYLIQWIRARRRPAKPESLSCISTESPRSPSRLLETAPSTPAEPLSPNSDDEFFPENMTSTFTKEEVPSVNTGPGDLTYDFYSGIRNKDIT